jgi:multiple sugar transport system substrate-binding protein
MQIAAPTATGEPVTVDEESGATNPAYPTVTLWVNKTAPQYEAALREMIAEFTASHQVHVELVTVAPDTMPDLISTAAVSETFSLPDMVVLPLEYTVGWAERGILDPSAAQAVVEELDPATFDANALNLVTVEGQAAAIPSDGWQQLLIYRSDWFEEHGLAPPTSFNTMIRASEVISDRANLIYSFNMPTESSLRATTRAFEQMATANGCQIIDEKGEILIMQPQCQDSFEFYRFICNTYCPPGVQTEVSALNAYLEGRTAMIFAPPSVLPVLAGLDQTYTPSCEACDSASYLAENTGVVTAISGRSPAAPAEPQNFSEISYLGITTEADREAAIAFARFWFNDGYLRWLGVEPEWKVPMRLGTPQEPTRYIDAWYELPMSSDGRTLSDIYSPEIASTIATNVATDTRWGYKQGHGAFITEIYEDLTMSILLQELLSGYYNSERAAIEGYKRLVDLIPDYPYYVDPEPTPEDE